MVIQYIYIGISWWVVRRDCGKDPVQRLAKHDSPVQQLSCFRNSMLSSLNKMCGLFAVYNSGLLTPLNYISISVNKFFGVFTLMPTPSIGEIQGELNVFTWHINVCCVALHIKITSIVIITNKKLLTSYNL